MTANLIWLDQITPPRAYVSKNGRKAGFVNVTYKEAPDGSHVIGNGTLPHPLTVKLSRLAKAAPELLAMLETMTRAAHVEAGDVLNTYAICVKQMTKARELCASLVDPETYLARARAKAKPREALAEAVRLFDTEASDEHPDPIDDGINMAREALRLLKLNA